MDELEEVDEVGNRIKLNASVLVYRAIEEALEVDDAAEAVDLLSR